MLIFAGYAAQAIANATAYERLEQQSTELTRQLVSQRRLLEINERLLSTLDSTAVMETIADGLLSVVRYDNLSIYRADAVDRQLVPVVVRERHEEQVRNFVIPYGQGLMGWAVDHGESVLANDALNDPRAVQIPGTPPDPEALCVVPLISEGEVIGCMNISRIGGVEAYFSENDFELVKLFAGQASIALRNAEAHTEVSLRADTDALTGLGNHGAFQRTLSEVLERPASRRRGVSLLMMDLDRFKGYNDRLGHPAGDALLHAIGTAIYGAARSEDRVFRYGGDEFVLILPGVDAHAAAEIGERVRTAVSRLTTAESMPVTIAVGVAAFPADARDKNELIGAADTALYYGKRAGGDRVTVASEVPHEVRDLRHTLDELARAALRHAEEPAVAQRLPEPAASGSDSVGEDAVRQALLTMARSLDGQGSRRRGPGGRIARLASRVAQQLGCDPDAVRDVELAARLHLMPGFDPATLDGIGALDDVLATAQPGPDSAPDGQPLAAQIIDAAAAYDRLTTGVDQPRMGRATAIAALRGEIGTHLRRDVVEALAIVVAQHPDAGQRRRRGDERREVRGAA